MRTRAATRIKGFAKGLLVDGAVRRGARAGVVSPALFAIGLLVIGNVAIGTFAAIGAFCLLLLVEFGGTMRERIQAELGLIGAGAVLLAIGTLISPHVAVAAPVILVIAFAILFSGVVSSVLASASISLLLAVILAVSLPAGPAAVGPRLAGWALAAGGSLLAIRFLWPAPVTDPLRAPTVAACRALAAALHAGAARWRGAPEDVDALDAAAEKAVSALHRAFLSAPSRPTGLTTAARARVRLIDELAWIRDVLERPATKGAGGGPVDAVKDAAADLLDEAATLLERPDTPPDALHAAQGRLDAALARMAREATVTLPLELTGNGHVNEFVGALAPSFRVQELAYAVRLVAGNVELSVAAERRTWGQRLLGQQPGGLAGPWRTARERAMAHLEPHSTWLHNSLRGALGIAAAVVVVHYTGVQHSFWVIFGTLAVLRSNALATGQNAIRAILGTVVGFVIGAVILIGVGTDINVLWALLPVAVLMAGIAPARISFAAGQAAFTVALLILFNIIQPAGWQLGLIRVEDVAIGVGISILVGLLLWPRGARKELRRALADSYADSAHYLHAAVAYAAHCCDDGGRPQAPTAEAQRAAASARRLDDTFRTYLNERGAKPMPLAEITSLVNGVAALRITADAVLDLWQRDNPAAGDRAAARTLLLSSSEDVERWYTELAATLAGDGAAPTPAPDPPDLTAGDRLIAAVRRDLDSGDSNATSAAVRVIWTADHLDAARRLEVTLTGPARVAETHPVTG
ncbi:fusaric acid resistance family protein [Asanoa ferruginea]|uniref:Fusaric acid resistance family protein n=1 Tax=Asanoa ferruginea TaxID=53367 RepID=A0A3D9ZV32_9ACTN|nr:FUSC family protein [Asanoa ferruginea]REG00353.1 fusaric acid resistance family protein [Asanoa ferruginea]GIF51860.1 FUSC family protein [Asanoa ferruginea]